MLFTFLLITCLLGRAKGIVSVNYLLINLLRAYFLYTASDRAWDHISGNELFSCYCNIFLPPSFHFILYAFSKYRLHGLKFRKPQKGHSSMVKCLPCMHKALGQIPSTTKLKKTQRLYNYVLLLLPLLPAPLQNCSYRFLSENS